MASWVACGASNGPDQDFLLISILVVIFHNVQYLGLVWFHNRNRYGESTGHGLAQLVNRSPAYFLGACALFSAVISFASACATGAFPGCAPFADRQLGPVSWNQIGLCLWWGLAMNHYVLDQKIWRIRGMSIVDFTEYICSGQCAMFTSPFSTDFVPSVARRISSKTTRPSSILNVVFMSARNGR